MHLPNWTFVILPPSRALRTLAYHAASVLAPFDGKH